MTDLSALAPLRLGYLRRLREFAARLAPENALLEVALRGEDDRPVYSNAGLPARADAADRSTGETFEVAGATPDEPLAATLTAGALTVRLEPGNWERLPLRLVFARAPTDAEVEALADLVRSWATVAAYGGYGPGEPGFSGTLHDLALLSAESGLAFLLDLGTAPLAAVEALFIALDGFHRSTAALGEISLGGPAPEPEPAAE